VKHQEVDSVLPADPEAPSRAAQAYAAGTRRGTHASGTRRPRTALIDTALIDQKCDPIEVCPPHPDACSCRDEAAAR
jgi:hypothetical protein